MSTTREIYRAMPFDDPTVQSWILGETTWAKAGASFDAEYEERSIRMVMEMLVGRGHMPKNTPEENLWYAALLRSLDGAAIHRITVAAGVQQCGHVKKKCTPLRFPEPGMELRPTAVPVPKQPGRFSGVTTPDYDRMVSVDYSYSAWNHHTAA